MGFDHDHETAALELILDLRSDGVTWHLNQLAKDELDQLADALDKLAVLVDAEAIRRAEKRP